jgi:pimeloyl-ACP methyl ester carboxylesterase
MIAMSSSSLFFRWAWAIFWEVPAILFIHALVFMRNSQQLAKGRPILLIHGYLHHAKVWGLQKKWLEALGHGPIYAINLGIPFQSIRTYAEKVQKMALKIAEEQGRSDLILIGHSMGGLVASWYATKLAKPNTVTDLITIASPLYGTPVAKIAIGPNGREMESNSPFLKELQALMKENKKIRFYHIATETDFFVIPGHSAFFKENPHAIYRNIGHTSLLLSRRVADQIHEWIKSS